MAQQIIPITQLVPKFQGIVRCNNYAMLQRTHRTTPSAHKAHTLTAASPQGKKRKQSAREKSSPQKSLKVTIKQKHVIEGEKDKESYADKFTTSMIHDDVDDSRNKIGHGTHKEHPKFVDDDEDNKEEKTDEKKYVEIEETVIEEDEVIPEDETPELIIKFKNVDNCVPTIFDHASMKATLTDMLNI
nr:hypothetical protein [Tanacetum cinerariifolium]